MSKFQFWFILLMLTSIEYKVDTVHTFLDKAFFTIIVTCSVVVLIMDVRKTLKGSKHD